MLKDIYNAVPIIQILNKHNFEGYVVGGSVRDFLMGKPCDDIDIATDATPNQVMDIFKGEGFETVPVGIEFGTVLVHKLPEYEATEITTYRSEGRYSDNRHPDTVVFETDLIKDLERRDFTINAIAFDPIKEEFVDPFNGGKDILDRKIKAVGDPNERFKEDPLRMIRLARFAGRLSFNIDFDTEVSAVTHSHKIKDISRERIKSEMDKIMKNENTSNCIRILYDIGILKEILPEVSSLRGRKQPKEHHRFDVFDHTLNVIDNVKDPILKYAALFHDIGKLKMNDESPYFPGHEDISAKMFEGITKRINFSNEEIREIKFLIEHHMDFTDEWILEEKYMRKYINKNQDYIDILPKVFELKTADIKGTGYEKIGRLKFINKAQNLFEKVINEEQPFSRKDLAINGKDIIDLGIPPSPKIGEMLDYLVDAVIDNPTINEREKLLSMVKNHNT